ncbi:MAG: hypothetical protein N3D84_01730 [Candidatus Woesearchaeota archaeon]|nr:hypothetical protein [Candidatus Woesearchaeota archaeon]
MSKKRERRERARLKAIYGGLHGIESGKKVSEVLESRPGISKQEKISKEKAKKHPAYIEKRTEGKGLSGFFTRLYEKHYKKMLVITLLIFVLAFVQIVYQFSATGDFINKGVSLKGGITITIKKPIEKESVELFLKKEFPKADISVRALSSSGSQIGLIIEASDAEEKALVESLKKEFSIEEGGYNVETIGSSLGKSFFKETIKALIMAFVFMGVVVFIYFSKEIWPRVISFIIGIIAVTSVYYSSKTVLLIIAVISIAYLGYLFARYSIPSIFVVLCVLCDIIETLAVVNLLGMKISTAGIAAFLMLIGYSVDTDILLTTRVLKRKEESIAESTTGALKTGIMLTATAIVAVVVALVFSKADILKEIMTIVLIGLLFDIINTWMQNASILSWYLKAKEMKAKQKAMEEAESKVD